VRPSGLPAHPDSAAALARLLAFRAELYACLARRADALLELGDALLCAESIGSLPHLSLEPTHRRGWGSTYAALASGRIDAERLRDLPAGHPLAGGQPIYAVDVTTWPRCDAECSPERGLYYHPSRHSAGQPIVAGWAWQWICQLGFARDSWTAPVDAARLHPLHDTGQAAAGQVRALLARLPEGQPVPLFVFDAGYDSAQLTVDLAEVSVAVLVRLRADRCFYADPPPRPTGATGRPRRHGAKFKCVDPATWPPPTNLLVTGDDQYGTVTVTAWAGLHPKQHNHPGRGTRAPRRSPVAPWCACRWSGSLPRPAHPRCCGCGGPAPAPPTWTWSGGRISAASPRRRRPPPPRPPDRPSHTLRAADLARRPARHAHRIKTQA
jgi:hypothetical protein